MCGALGNILHAGACAPTALSRFGSSPALSTCRLPATANFSSKPGRVRSTPRTTLAVLALMVAMNALFTSSPSCGMDGGGGHLEGGSCEAVAV